jgi:hypothetical protein
MKDENDEHDRVHLQHRQIFKERIYIDVSQSRTSFLFIKIFSLRDMNLL